MVAAFGATFKMFDGFLAGLTCGGVAIDETTVRFRAEVVYADITH